MDDISSYYFNSAILSVTAQKEQVESNCKEQQFIHNERSNKVQNHRSAAGGTMGRISRQVQESRET